MGIVGAGISLVASYAVVLVLMYVFTQRLFKVPYEWLRLAQAAGLAVVLVLAGELLLPTSGFWGLAGRTALWLAYPLLLWVTGFLNDEEREAAGRVLSPAYVKASLTRLREAPPTPEPEADEEKTPWPAPHARNARGRAARRGRDPLARRRSLQNPGHHSRPGASRRAGRRPLAPRDSAMAFRLPG